MSLFNSGRSEVLLLDVVNNERERFGFLAVVHDGHGGGALGLARLAFLVVLAVAQPLADVHAGVDRDHGDAVGLGQRGDELLVLGVVAVLSEDAEQRLFAVQGLADFVEALNET